MGEVAEAPGQAAAAGAAPRGSRRIVLVAGEASGDLHGAALAAEIRRQAPDILLEGMGGDRMARAGVSLVCHSAALAVVGLVEVAEKAAGLWRAFATMRRHLERTRPDLVILIDYPDFNLRLARVAKRVGVPVVYFISPQVWAWRRGRLRRIRALVRKMLVIFPFEEPLYREAGVEVAFVGHPLLDLIPAGLSRDAARRGLGIPPEATLVALLPGSREREVRRHLPVMLEAARRIRAARPAVDFVVAAADGLPGGMIEAMAGASVVRPGIVQGRTHEALGAADLVLTASGTATVEAALLQVPMVIIYRVSLLSWLIGRLAIRVPHIGMANLIAGRAVAPELIQFAATPGRLAQAALDLLGSAEGLEGMRAALGEVRRRLGTPGAAGRAAREVLDLLGAVPSGQAG